LTKGDKHLRHRENKKTKVSVLKKSLTLSGLCIDIAAITVLLYSCNKSDINSDIVSKQFNTIYRKASNRIILTIGDSNGVVNGGWPTALAAILKEDSIFNHSEGGRTIGFDNCGKMSWNALRNINSYLKWGLKQSRQKPLDEVIILLGTNDSKTCFDNQKHRVAPNLIKLIKKIRNFDNSNNPPPHITIVTPPPYAPDSLVLKRAIGGDYRVRLLVPQFRDVALQYHCALVNIYPLIKSRFHDAVMDHVHLNEKGHAIVAEAIAEVLNDWDAPEPPSDLLYDKKILSWNPSPSSDVIGYEILNRDSVIQTVARTEVKLHHGVNDPAVRTRDSYGNVSITVRP
jgi:lysophospholipase L1-like esterase